MKNKIGVIIQARMNSSRLPGKVLKKILGIPMLELLLNRIEKTSYLDEIVVATSSLKKDDPIADLINKKNKIKLYRGSEKNVLERFFLASKKYNLSHIMRVTGDNPFFDWIIAEKLISKIKQNDYDFVANNINPSFPYGIDLEIMTFESLTYAYNQSSNDYDLEHVTPYIRLRPKKFRILNFSNQNDQSDIRLTVDTAEDYNKACLIFQKYGPYVTFRDLN